MTYLLKKRPNFFDEDFFGNLPDFLRYPTEAQEFAKKQMAKAPEIDIKETENEYHLRCDIPGFKKDEVGIEFQDDTLILKGKKANETEENEDGFLRKERTMYEFERRFKFDQYINTEKVEAKLKDGVLAINLQKALEKRPKQISIRD